MAFDETKEAAKHLQNDAQQSVGELKSVAQDFWTEVVQRLGVVGGDAQQLVSEGSAYVREWTTLVREDIGHEVKGTITNAVLSIFGLFVAALGFLLLNMGAIWSLSPADLEVGRWFAAFGVGWILVGAILGVVAYSRERQAIQETKVKIRQDAELPQRHFQNVYQRYQEHRNESPTTHGHA